MVSRVTLFFLFGENLSFERFWGGTGELDLSSFSCWGFSFLATLSFLVAEEGFKGSYSLEEGLFNFDLAGFGFALLHLKLVKKKKC